MSDFSKVDLVKIKLALKVTERSNQFYPKLYGELIEKVNKMIEEDGKVVSDVFTK